MIFFWVSAEIWQLWIYMKGRCWCISRTVYWQLSFIACNDFHQSLKPISSLKNDLNLWKRWEPQATSNNFFTRHILGMHRNRVDCVQQTWPHLNHSSFGTTVLDGWFFFRGLWSATWQFSAKFVWTAWKSDEFAKCTCHTHWYLLYGHAHDGSINCFAHLGSTSTWNGPGTMRDLWQFLALKVLEITQKLHIGGIEWNLFKLDAFASG